MTKSERKRLCPSCQEKFPARRKVVKPAKKERLAKEADRLIAAVTEWSTIKRQVITRAVGRCEVAPWGNRCPAMGVDVDHWLNGNGRKRQKQSVETCWLLCREHHDQRQQYFPNVRMWNAWFDEHCQRWGYTTQPHIQHAPAARSALPSLSLESK